MANIFHDYVSAINRVIEICKDTEEGFQGAADAINDASLRDLFRQYSSQRARFADQLRAVVQETSNEPAHPSSVAGIMHCGWIVPRDILTKHSDNQILVEIERGEDLSLSRYHDALAVAMPPDLKALLEQQYAEVQQAYSRILGLRIGAAATLLSKANTNSC